MKIAQVVCSYPPYRGGIGNTAKEYTEGLRKKGHDVHVYTPNRKSIFAFGNAAFMPSLLWKLRSFDVIHLHYPFYGAAAFTAFASVVWRVPLILTYHMKTQSKGLKGFLFSLQRIFLEPFILGDTQCILASSIDYADSVGLSKYTVEAQPFAVDTDRFYPGKEESKRAELGILPGSTVFIFVAGLDDAHYFKGLFPLLEATAKLAKDESWDLLIVGGGNRKEVYENKVLTLGLENRVHFMGRVSDEELPACYRMADVHVLPSIDRSEAFGLVTLEAAASGLPSLVSNLPGVRTLVQKGKTGLLAKAGDIVSWKIVMEDMINDKDLQSAWGANARRMVEEGYEKSILLDRLISKYKSVRVLRHL